MRSTADRLEALNCAVSVQFSAVSVQFSVVFFRILYIYIYIYKYIYIYIMYIIYPSIAAGGFSV